MKWPALLLLALIASSCRRAEAPASAAEPPGRVLGIAHMALFVSDLTKARGFYRDLLGFEEAFTLPKPDGSAGSAIIKVNDQQYIELFAEPPGNDGRIHDISFYADDVKALRERLAARGVPVPKEVGKGRIGNPQFTITDPDGHSVELVQYQPGGWSARDSGKFMPDSRISTRIAHVGVTVAVLEKSLKFYRDSLGFQETWRGGPSDKVLSWVNARVAGGEDYLELMLYDTPLTPVELGGKNHICLTVPDVAQALARLEARPARKSYERPIQMRLGTNRKRQANLFDPDGTRVELMEPTTIDGKPTPPVQGAPAPLTTEPMAENLSRYLTCKKTVDDRALNRFVIERLRAEIAARDVAKLRVLEVGGGLGNMLARLVDWGVLRQAEYFLLDVDQPVLESARAWLMAWSRDRGFGAAAEGDRLRITGDGGIEVEVRFVQAELGELVAEAPNLLAADLLIANAVLDLVEVPKLLPRLFDLAVPHGIYWFSVNYDGETIFQPEHPDDDRFMRLYNRSMDERVRFGRPAGESRTGRHLFGHLRAAGASIVAAGSSDWVVHPGADGYPGDEAHFLHIVVDTIGEALSSYPEVDGHALTSWLALRRQQIDRAELTYLAHQLDFMGRCP